MAGICAPFAMEAPWARPGALEQLQAPIATSYQCHGLRMRCLKAHGDSNPID